MRLIGLISVMIIVSTNPHVQNDIPHLTGQPEEEVLAVIKQWNESFESNNSEEYFSYIHDDITLFVPSSPYRIDGKTDDREEFEWSLNKGRSRVSLFQELQPTVQMLSNISAIVTYHNRGIYGSKEQEQMN